MKQNTALTREELVHIRAAATGDMLGDSRALDELGPSAIIFRLCGEVERLGHENDKARAPCLNSGIRGKDPVWMTQPQQANIAPKGALFGGTICEGPSTP